ncbi:MGMT family protein, partial [Methylophaga sp. UBA3991]
MIWQTVDAIPYGQVMTYGQIAISCGYPGYARYVG